MSEITLIIHGWSDCSQSFEKLKKALLKGGVGKVESIYYCDYESREDNVSFEDVVDGLNDEMLNWGFIDRQGKKRHNLNVVVHSTGGLVIRHWIWRYYYKYGNRIADCPVKRLVMLAPANFGSPLAHRGKSFLGSLLKGRWKTGDLFETGKNLLEGLELASPYQWQLAHRDLFVPSSYYNAQEIQTTIMVGIQDYQGLKGWVNKPGTDGTVVIAGTSLDSAKLRLDFSKPEVKGATYTPSDWQITNPPDDFAFGVLEGLDHGSIVAEAGKSNTAVNRHLLKALKVKTAGEFEGFQTELDKTTAQTYARTRKPQYQQYIFHAIDDQEKPVRDYTIEFYIYSADKASKQIIRKEILSHKEFFYSQQVHRILTSEFHKHTQDPSFRRILVDIEQVKKTVSDAKKDIGKNVVLSLRVFVPRIDNGIYYRTANLQNILLYDPAAMGPGKMSFLYPNTTTLIEMKIDRYNTYVQIGKKPVQH